MPSIRSFTITYDARNESNTFSEGDSLTGNVTLALLKDTTVESLFIKVKGDANVRWTQKTGDRTYTYSSHKRYFKLKQFLIPEDSEDTILPKGNHVYSFRFILPSASMPSSFRGSHGKIVYCLEAKLSRSWKIDTTAEKEIAFVSKVFPNLPALMSPQIGSTRKEVGLFSKGSVTMDVSMNKAAYAAGEKLVAIAKINNSSSSEMTPKFSLQRSIVYHAQNHKKHSANSVHKVVDHRIAAHTQKEVQCVMQIPRDEVMTIHNCEIISLSYLLKVYLDISFAFDPEVVFPIVITHPDLASGCQNAVAMSPHSSDAVWGPSNSDFPAPVVFMGSYPRSPHAGSYRYPGAQSYPTPPPAYPGNPPVYPGPSLVYPPLPAPMASGYSNPQVFSPFGDSLVSPSSTLHPPPSSAPHFPPPPSAPTAPPLQPPPSLSPSAPPYNSVPSTSMTNFDFLSQTDEAPPSYSLLFPSSTPETSDDK